MAPCLPTREFVAESVRRCNGVLLTGGDDIQPRLYTEKLSPKLHKTVHLAIPERDLFELMLIDEVFRQRRPLLAICRGHQLLNVALGGTLIVDIPLQRPGAMKHTQMERKNEIVHEVDVQVGSLLAQIVDIPRLGVNSTHHQAVEKVAKPLCVSAASIDGIVEGLELTPGQRHLLPFLLAVQFHPERLFARHREHFELFRCFIRACTRNRRARV